MTAPSDDGADRALLLRGDIDMATADDVVAQGVRLLDEGEAGAPLILDLDEVTFFDSSGLSALVRLRRSARDRGTQVILRNVPDSVTVLLRLSGLTEHFPVM